MSRLTKKLEPPYEKIAGEDYVYTSNTRLTKSFVSVEQKLGQYEDIDENPEHLVDIKKAFKIIKDKKVDVAYIMENPEEKNAIWYSARFMGVLCEGWRMLSQEEYDLVRKVLL